MKVMFYDGWTRGLHCFKPVFDELTRRGHEAVLVHTGSQKELGVPKEQTLGGLLCRDVSFYKNQLIHNIFKQEKPDVFLSLNTSFLWDRANVESARKLGIPTFFMMHGERLLGDEIEKFLNTQKLSPVTTDKPAQSKLKRYALQVIPNYLYSKWASRPNSLLSPSTYKNIWNFARHPQRVRLLPENTHDLIHDYCLVYSKKYVDYYNRTFGYNADQIHVIGKPEYDDLFAMNGDIPLSLLPGELNEQLDAYAGYVLYVENGYVESTFKGWDNAYRDNLIANIAAQLELDNLLLVIKCHPLTMTENIQVPHNAVIIQGGHNNAIMHHAQYAIGHSSTLNDLAILMDKPLVIPQWGASALVPNMYKDFPGMVSYWNDENDQISLAHNERAREAYKDISFKIYEDGKTSSDYVVSLMEKAVAQ